MKINRDNRYLLSLRTIVLRSSVLELDKLVFFKQLELDLNLPARMRITESPVLIMIHLPASQFVANAQIYKGRNIAIVTLFNKE